MVNHFLQVRWILSKSKDISPFNYSFVPSLYEIRAQENKSKSILLLINTICKIKKKEKASVFFATVFLNYKTW